MQIKFIRLIDEKFDGLPQTREVLELKEEMVQNLMEKYQDLIAEGKTEEAAFGIAAASVGDVSELIDGLMPQAPEPENPFDFGDSEMPYTAPPSAGPAGAPQIMGHTIGTPLNKQQQAAITAFGVMLYILCPVPIFMFQSTLGLGLLMAFVAAATGLFIYLGMAKPKKGEEEAVYMQQMSPEMYKQQSAAIIPMAVMLYILCAVPVIFFHRSNFGLVLMFFMIAAATGMLVYNGMMKPKAGSEHSGYDGYDGYDGYANSQDEEAYAEYLTRGKKKRVTRKAEKSLSSAIGALTTAVYFLVSFSTGAWHVSWVIFLIGGALGNILKAYADMKESR